MKTDAYTKTMLTVIAILLAVIAFRSVDFKSLFSPDATARPGFSQFVEQVKNNEVANVLINSTTGEISGHYKGKGQFRSSIPAAQGYNDFFRLLIDNQVTIQGGHS